MGFLVWIGVGLVAGWLAGGGYGVPVRSSATAITATALHGGATVN